MMRPTPEQERWLVVAVRFALSLDESRSGGWHAVGWLMRLALFVLGMVAAAMLVAIAELLHLRPHALWPALILIVTAEVLIATRKLSQCGIEEACFLSGVGLLTYWIVDAGLAMHDEEVAALLAITFSLAAWRLRNALFTAGAALLWALLIFVTLPAESSLRFQVTGLCCYAVAWAAMALGHFPFRRPSVDHRLNWLVLLMPLAGYLWLAEVSLFGVSQPLRLEVLAMPILFGLSALWAGLQRRQHAPLLASMVCVVCLAYELRWVSGWSLTQRLLVWGSVTLIAALLIDRWLRVPVRGVTAKQVNDTAGPLELIQLAGAAVITPRAAAVETSFKGEGGGFGGGGADGKF